MSQMSQDINFTWEIFINMVDNLFYKNIGRQITKLEQELLWCFWHEMKPSSIFRVLNEKRAELNYYYNDKYFRMGLEPDLMKKLSRFINEPVNKKTFKEVYKRIWERDNGVNFSQD